MSIESIQQIDYLILPCRDLGTARSFYINIMKLNLIEDHEQWVRFEIGPTSLTLRPRGKWLNWDDGKALERSTCVQMAFKVNYDEVDSCYHELIGQGVEIVEEPIDQEFGHRTLFFRDTEANLLEIFAELD